MGGIRCFDLCTGLATGGWGESRAAWVIGTCFRVDPSSGPRLRMRPILPCWSKDFNSASKTPRVMGIGPAPATQKVLALTGLRLDQIDVIELNEAFAAQGLAVLRQLGLQDDDERVNHVITYGKVVSTLNEARNRAPKE